MKISKKKFIYLISPNNIYPQFYQDLNKVLKTRKVGLFQLRLKKYSFKRKILIGKKIQQICKKNSVKFIVNDDPTLSKKLNADGCHLGQKDMNINNAKKIIGDIKKLKLKIQIKIQGEELRVDGKKRDDLQEAIAAIKTIDIGLPIEFINFRD